VKLKLNCGLVIALWLGAFPCVGRFFGTEERQPD